MIPHPRRLLAFCLAVLLLSPAASQLEEDDDPAANEALPPEEDEEASEARDDYIDNRIDAAPTYVSPGERFVKAVLAPLGWLSHSAAPGESGGGGGGIGNLINGIANPIRQIVSPGGRANSGGFGEVLNIIGDRFKAIYPGTEWCGAGSSAKNPEEVGLFKRTDRCCRAHDQCNVNLNAGDTAYGLRNNGIFTRSHCVCDAHFYHCLKEAHSLVATNIGLTYFNLLRPQCFKQEYPAYCVRYGRTRLRNNKCLDYDYDYKKNRTWQWFDSPDFL